MKLKNLYFFRSLFCVLAIVRHCHLLMCPVSSWGPSMILEDSAGISCKISNFKQGLVFTSKVKQQSLHWRRGMRLKSPVCPCSVFLLLSCICPNCKYIAYFRELGSIKTYRNNFKPSIYTKPKAVFMCITYKNIEANSPQYPLCPFSTHDLTEG